MPLKIAIDSQQPARMAVQRQEVQAPLAGQTLSARITRSLSEACELELMDAQTGKVLALGRLRQESSLAWQSSQTMNQLPQYRVHTVLPQVVVMRERTEAGKPLWFVHERWGQHNPWLDLALKEDDIVTGTVEAYTYKADDPSHTPRGCYVQLTIGMEIETAGKSNHDEPPRAQPDIQVYLPFAEMPPCPALGQGRAAHQHLSVNVGDQIKAIVLRIRTPPYWPLISVRRLADHLDAQGDSRFLHRETLSMWRFRRFFGASTPHTHNLDDRVDQWQLYQNKLFLVIDDDEHALTTQVDMLERMGAQAKPVCVANNNLTGAETQARQLLALHRFDLVLVDDCLPGRGMGRRLIERLAQSLDAENRPKFALSSAVFLDAQGLPETPALQALGVVGMLTRPFSHKALQQLLAGQLIWPVPNQPSSQPLVTTVPHQRPAQAMLEQLRAQYNLRYVALIPAQKIAQGANWLSAGDLPFTPQQWEYVLTQSELDVLLHQRTDHFLTTASEAGNENLRLHRGDTVYWERLPEAEGESWLLGVSFAEAPSGSLSPAGISSASLEQILPLWRLALRAALQAHALQLWVQHSAYFVELGMAHLGLTHEVMNLQSELHDRLDAMQSGLEQARRNHYTLEQTVERYLHADLKNLGNDLTKLRDFSRAQLTNLAMRHEVVDLPTAMAEIERLIGPEAGQTHARVVFSKVPRLALQLVNVNFLLPIVNLLINSIKHHHRADNARVELMLDLEDLGSRQNLLVDVRDNGPGISAAMQTRLWQAGYSSATKAEQRHGMGLWLSRRLAQQAGGSLELVESWRGLGCWFRLRFPLVMG